ncbi:hypothetical protein BDY19DRAFT_908368 [Irpex rosettiformis]|uniref:Uncharacterized protein n=1 Tax=Irpex rosettiformis TaxID=378272 RepID=A0ACB8TWJ8_9APHY|nr:hypothetical protein BDY19DRAFT_908368 [Irpex rosettiformis]
MVMDANALKKLSRREIQKLAQREKIKANARTLVIIDQLLEKYPEGVPELSPAPHKSLKAKELEETMEEGVAKVQSETTAATQEKVAEDQSSTATAEVSNAARLPVSGPGSPSLFAFTKNENEPTQPSARNEPQSKEQKEGENDTQEKSESLVLVAGEEVVLKTPREPSVAPVSRISPTRRPYPIDKSSRKSASWPGAFRESDGRHTDTEAVMEHARKLESYLRKAQVEAPSVERPIAGASRAAEHLSSVSGAQRRGSAESKMSQKDRGAYTSSSSGVPDGVTPPQSKRGNRDPTEAQVMLLRQRLAEHMRAAKHWSRVLGETTTILGACNVRNQEVSKRKEEVVVRREEVENSYQRLRNSKRKAEEDEEDEDVSEDQDTSDFVATSDSSSDSPFDGDADPMRALQAVCRGKPVFFRGQYFPGDDSLTLSRVTQGQVKNTTPCTRQKPALILRSLTSVEDGEKVFAAGKKEMPAISMKDYDEDSLP